MKAVAITAMTVIVCAATAAGRADTRLSRPSLTLTQDYFNDFSGGIAPGDGALGMADLQTDLNRTDNNGTTRDLVHVDLLALYGNSISNHVGDLQGLDNIEAHRGFRVFEAWYEHHFTLANGTLAVRTGLQDYNALFDTRDATGVFINSSLGLAPTIAQAGVSTFPDTAVGAALHWRRTSGAYLLLGVYDGVPGLPGYPGVTRIAFRAGDGTLSALETGLNLADGPHPYKLALGGWYRSTTFTDPYGLNRVHNDGVYLLGQRQLSQAGPRSLTAFFQLGYAPHALNTVTRYADAGVTVRSPLASRPADTLGIALAWVETGSGYRDTLAEPAVAETAIEVTWQAVLTPHLSLQPDIQYVANPGANARPADAWVAGIRLQGTW